MIARTPEGIAASSAPDSIAAAAMPSPSIAIASLMTAAAAGSE
jgi:hypothetical protein